MSQYCYHGDGHQLHTLQYLEYILYNAAAAQLIKFIADLTMLDCLYSLIAMVPQVCHHLVVPCFVLGCQVDLDPTNIWKYRHPLHSESVLTVYQQGPLEHDH